MVVAQETSGPFEALGDANRRDILRLLGLGEKSVQEIADQLPISRPAVSRQLKLLTNAGLVSSDRRGTRQIYRLQEEAFGPCRTPSRPCGATSRPGSDQWPKTRIPSPEEGCGVSDPLTYISFIEVDEDATRVEIVHTGRERLGADGPDRHERTIGGWSGVGVGVDVGHATSRIGCGSTVHRTARFATVRARAVPSR